MMHSIMIPYLGYMSIDNDSPVVFIHKGGPRNRSELWPGVFHDGSIFYDTGSIPSAIESFKPETGTFFPVGSEYLSKMAHAYRKIWDAVANVQKDDSLLYKNGLPPISAVEEGKISWADYESGIQKNEDRITEIDSIQRDKQETLYRFVRYGVGDGYAVYQVVEICGSHARLRHCKGLGDDWVYEPYGVEALVPLKQIELELRLKDETHRRFKRA